MLLMWNVYPKTQGKDTQIDLLFESLPEIQVYLWVVCHENRNWWGSNYNARFGSSEGCVVLPATKQSEIVLWNYPPFDDTE